MKAFIRIMCLVVCIVLIKESSKVLFGQQANNTNYNQVNFDKEEERDSQTKATANKTKLTFVLRDYPNKLLEDTFFPIVDKK